MNIIIPPDLILYILSLEIDSYEKIAFVKLLNTAYIDHYLNGKRPKKLEAAELFWEDLSDIQMNSEYCEEKERSRIFVDQNFSEQEYLVRQAETEP